MAAGIFFHLDMAFWHSSLMPASVAKAIFQVTVGNISVALTARLVLKERLTPSWLIAAVVALACGAAAFARRRK